MRNYVQTSRRTSSPRGQHQKNAIPVTLTNLIYREEIMNDLSNLHIVYNRMLSSGYLINSKYVYIYRYLL